MSATTTKNGSKWSAERLAKFRATNAAKRALEAAQGTSIPLDAIPARGKRKYAKAVPAQQTLEFRAGQFIITVRLA